MAEYEFESKIFKAMSEPTRLKILDLLSCCERCACDILDSLSITQSTLSHHMKVLMNCGLVAGRKSATWMFYSISQERVKMVQQFIEILTHPGEGCEYKPHQPVCG
jgi:ArsR family transcriptional regulator, arsenate/arsenite/antimonite-responsive transcriptional repressor